jgi:hypothetical protein
MKAIRFGMIILGLIDSRLPEAKMEAFSLLCLALKNKTEVGGRTEAAQRS